MNYSLIFRGVKVEGFYVILNKEAFFTRPSICLSALECPVQDNEVNSVTMFWLL